MRLVLVGACGGGGVNLKAHAVQFRDRPVTATGLLAPSGALALLLALWWPSAGLAKPPAADADGRGASAQVIPAWACAKPTMGQLIAQPAIRAQLLSRSPDGMELKVLPQHAPSGRGGTQGRGRLVGHWVHLSESGPANGALAWWPCSAVAERRAVPALSSGGFVAWRVLPAEGTLPTRLVLTHRHTGTGLESHGTQVIEVDGGRLRVLLEATTFETAALAQQHETHAELLGLQPGRRVTVQTTQLVDGERQRRKTRHWCWSAPRRTYGACP